mmetsp:Transcript_43898/g.71375  ORF Transcript_43898/g.71375 Transcript_43898/m.71375 type:complete len:210 (+) Transcript_43898:193-822(+)
MSPLSSLPFLLVVPSSSFPSFPFSFCLSSRLATVSVCAFGGDGTSCPRSVDGHGRSIVGGRTGHELELLHLLMLLLLLLQRLLLVKVDPVEDREDGRKVFGVVAGLVPLVDLGVDGVRVDEVAQEAHLLDHDVGLAFQSGELLAHLLVLLLQDVSLLLELLDALLLALSRSLCRLSVFGEAFVLLVVLVVKVALLVLRGKGGRRRRGGG